MRVLIVSCAFPPEPLVSARTSAQVAGALVARGHRVTVIAPFPNRPAGRLYPGYARRLFRRERSPEGYDVLRCWSTLSPASLLLSRALENISFGVTGAWAALAADRPHAIYANTWPLLATGLLYLVARLRRVPLAISVQDVYPDSLVVQGRLRAGGLLARALRCLDGLIARRAEALIAISERFAALYRDGRRVDPRRLHVIPNWVDRDRVDPQDRSAGFRAAVRVPDDAFLVVYGGNVGAAAGVETVIEAFRCLGDAERACLLVAGEGSRLAACRALAGDIPAGRVAFYAPWPAAETSHVLTAADVLVLPTQGRQSLASVPSKLIAYMLAARPVIALALPESDLAAIVARSGCGWVVPPDEPGALAARLGEIVGAERAELDRRGQAGRDFALQHLTREACLPRVIEVLEGLAARGAARGGR